MQLGVVIVRNMIQLLTHHLTVCPVCLEYIPAEYTLSPRQLALPHEKADNPLSVTPTQEQQMTTGDDKRKSCYLIQTNLCPFSQRN